jgi:hypothetical protein
MKLATIAGTLGTIAAGAVIVASAPATPSSAAPAPVHAARMTHELPRWVRWSWTHDRVNGKPCVIVVGGRAERRGDMPGRALA